MSGDVLDLIDNAIEAHEVSADAMRWTPEAPEPVDVLAAYRQVFARTWPELPEISFGFIHHTPCPWCDAPVPSGLSRESNQASDERGTA